MMHNVHLVIVFFYLKIGVFQETVVRVYHIVNEDLKIESN